MKATMSETPTKPGTNPIADLRVLRTMIEEVAVSLRSQRDILRMRGMSLPPMVLQTVSSIEKDLNDLEHYVMNDQTELGQLRALADTSALMNSTLDVDEVLHTAMEVVITLTGAERGYIILKQEDGSLEFSVSQDTTVTEGRQASGPPKLSQSILKEVLTEGKPLLTDNAYDDERLQNNMSVVNLTLRSVLCVPLAYKGNVFGAVYVDNRVRTAVFEERERNLLSAFANQAAVAIENARLFRGIQQSLVEISEIKELTDNVFSSIGSGVLTADGTNRIQTANQAALSILGRVDQDALVHKSLNQVLPGVSANFDDHISEVRASGEAQKLEAELQVPERGRIAIDMKISPLIDARGAGGGAGQGVALVIDDVTEQRARDQQLGSIKRYLPPQMVENIHQISGLELGGERRDVTCVYINVYDLSHLPPGMSPQQIMETMNRYLAVATECVHQAGGIIDKYMGNVVMALFNTQLNTMRDHADRALASALAVRHDLIPLYADTGMVEINGDIKDNHYYRIGINTGVVTLGNVGSLRRREFTAIGDTINLAKRLEENAVDGQIIVSEHTHAQLNAVQDAVHFSPLEPLKVKGRQQFTPIYEVLQD